jgi:hypothetical protein
VMRSASSLDAARSVATSEFREGVGGVVDCGLEGEMVGGIGDSGAGDIVSVEFEFEGEICGMKEEEGDTSGFLIEVFTIVSCNFW